MSQAYLRSWDLNACAGICSLCTVHAAHQVVTWAAATVHPFPHSSVGRKLEQHVYVYIWHRGCLASLCVSEGASGLTHIILNRIFPSRVLLPLSFRSLPQDSRLSTNSAAMPRADCLFWSVIVPEQQKPWVSIVFTSPTCHAPFNY